jgi:hypothetical protein
VALTFSLTLSTLLDMWAITPVRVLLVAAPLVHVESPTNCPSAEDIAERLRPLVPDRPRGDGSDGTAFIDVIGADPSGTTEGALHAHLHLVGGDGDEPGNRDIVLPSNCHEAAAIVASIIAVWQTEVFATLDARSAPVASAARPVAPSGWVIAAGPSMGVALVGGVALAGQIDGSIGQSGSRLQAHLGAGSETLRTLSLYPGKVYWRQTTFEAGILVRTLHSAWPLSADAGLLLGWATLTGRGYAQDRREESFEYGVCVAARLAHSLGRLTTWLEGRGLGWAQGQKAALIGAGATASLPRVDIIASLGISVPFPR